MAQRINTTAKALDEIKQEIPYLVVVNPQLMKAATYDRKYKMVFGNADAERFCELAKKYAVNTVQGFNLTYDWQQPAWITEEAKKDCVMYFLYNDGSTIHYLRSIKRTFGE